MSNFWSGVIAMLLVAAGGLVVAGAFASLVTVFRGGTRAQARPAGATGQPINLIWREDGEDVDAPPLVAHAQREATIYLDSLREKDDMEVEVMRSLVAAVAEFATYRGHSGMSHEIAVRMLTVLLDMGTLAPLTDSPDEWMPLDYDFDTGPGRDLRQDDPANIRIALWQNRRDSRAFSRDGGATYTLANDSKPREYVSAKAHS